MSPVISKALVNNTFKTKGDSFFANNEYKKAVSNYLNALFIERNNAEIYYSLGVCYKKWIWTSCGNGY